MGYVRVSSKGQVNNSGFGHQQNAIRAYVKQAGYRLVKVYQEAHTGTEVDRPVFNEMIQDLLTSGCTVVIIESLDCLVRDVAVQIQLLALLIAKDITLIAASTGQDITEDMSDPMLKAMIQIQGIFSELNKNLKGY